MKIDLGVYQTATSINFNSADEITGQYIVVKIANINMSTYNVPVPYGILVVFSSNQYTTQVLYPHINGANVTDAYFRFYNGDVWSEWSTLSSNIPNFYKNYSDLNTLASALGVCTSIKRRIIDAGQTVQATGLLIWGRRYNGIEMIMGIGYNNITIIYQRDAAVPPPVSVNGYYVTNNSNGPLYMLDFYENAT